MPLNVSVKTNPHNPGSQPAQKPVVPFNVPSKSTARAAELKQRLTGQPQQTAPRHAGSSARQAQYAAQPRYPVPPITQPIQAQPVAAPVAPAPAQPFSNIEPPPSGNPAERAAAQAGIAPPAAAPIAAPRAPSPTAAEVPAAPAEVTSEPMSPQFAALARRERQVRKAQQAFEAARDAWKQDQAQYVPKTALTGPDALKTLAELGLSADRLLELQASQANPDPNQQLLDKITQLEAKLSQVDKTFEARDTQQKQQALRQIRSDVELLVDSDPAYETIVATQSYGDVVDLIEKVFDAEGVILTVEDASRQVEEKLVEREYQRYERLGKLQKIQSRLAPKAPTAQPAMVANTAEATPQPQQPAEQPTQPQAAPKQQTTLTNTGAVTRPLSARERAIQAIERARGNL